MVTHDAAAAAQARTLIHLEKGERSPDRQPDTMYSLRLIFKNAMRHKLRTA
jgi:ABC-type lipoprotein export system ATPase subunit